MKSSGELGCLLFKPQLGADTTLILLLSNGAVFEEVVIREQTVWLKAYIFSSGFFPEGNYEFFPYIIIEQEGLPLELLLSIDSEILQFSHHYLKFGRFYTAAILTVSEFS